MSRSGGFHWTSDCQACELLQNSLKGVQRKRITNWRGYVYSLIRKVDESVYHEMKESKEKEKEENGTRRRSKKSEENLLNPASAPSKKTLDKTATEFVPGKPWNTPEVVKAPEVAPKTLRKDAAEFVPTAQAELRKWRRLRQLRHCRPHSLLP